MPLLGFVERAVRKKEKEKKQHQCFLLDAAEN
jgi:hypothetical protein